MRHASGHNYRNSSFIVDVAMGQIPRSTERISSYVISQLRAYTYLLLLLVCGNTGHLCPVCSHLFVVLFQACGCGLIVVCHGGKWLL